MQETFAKNGDVPPKGAGIFFYCLIAYLAILSVSNTVALRNILLLILVVGIFFSAAMSFKRQKTTDLSGLLARVPVIFLLWTAFLVLFPFWAVDAGVA